MCIIRNDSLECFRGGNTAYEAEEKEHLKRVFGEANCSVSDDYHYVACEASDLGCIVVSDGTVRCVDGAANLRCTVYYEDTVNCGFVS